MMRFALALPLLFSLYPSPMGVDTVAFSLQGALVPAVACEASDLLSPAIGFEVFQAIAAPRPNKNPTFPQAGPPRSRVQTVFARKRGLIAPAAVDPVPHHCERLPYQPTAPPFLR